MGIKLYYDFLSQPSRAVYIFMKLAGIPFEPCPVELASGVHLSDEFKEKFSKFQKVPFIHDGDFRLTESIAIVRYLSREYSVPENWYPKNSKRQAIIDEYLEWQHLNTRLFGSRYFLLTWMFPKIRGTQPKEEKVKLHRKELVKALENFENLFLSDSKFIFGDKISYADLAAACEIEQPRLAGFDATHHYPKIKDWIDNVRKECSPVYQEAHTLLNELVEANEMQAKL